MALKNKTINLYTEWQPLIEGLTDEEAGKLLKDIFRYQSNEVVENQNPVWLFVKTKIDGYNENGLAISKARSEAGKKGMEARWNVTKGNKDNNCYTEITNDNKNNNCYQMITNDNKNNNKIKENKIQEEKENKKEKEKAPTYEEVEAYAQSRNRVDLLKKFWEYFNETGWIDSNGKKVKNWKGKFLTWESHTEKPKEPQQRIWWSE